MSAGPSAGCRLAGQVTSHEWCTLSVQPGEIFGEWRSRGWWVGYPWDPQTIPLIESPSRKFDPVGNRTPDLKAESPAPYQLSYMLYMPFALHVSKIRNTIETVFPELIRRIVDIRQPLAGCGLEGRIY